MSRPFPRDSVLKNKSCFKRSWDRLAEFIPSSEVLLKRAVIENVTTLSLSWNTIFLTKFHHLVTFILQCYDNINFECDIYKEE